MAIAEPHSAAEIAIAVRNLSKRYRVRSASEMRWVNLLAPRYIPADERIDHWVLRSLSFDIPRGCKLALVGENGSGKSTLLKLLAGVIEPTTGRVFVQGSVLPLLELGAGFHPDLTGYENAFLQASILGLSREYIRSRLGEIVEFSELEDFMETPVKYYSSGMIARLGFSVAIHCSPDILLVDEILAVGDPDFQDKSFHKMMEFVGGGRTLILVSHNLFAVREICDQAIWLDEGTIREMGPARTVVPNYMDWNRQRAEQFEPSKEETTGKPSPDPAQAPKCRVESIRFFDHEDRETNRFQTQEPARIELDCEAERTTGNVEICILLFGTKRDPVLQIDSFSKTLRLPAGRSRIQVAIDRLAALPFEYRLEVRLLWHPPEHASLTLDRVSRTLVVYGTEKESTEQLIRTHWQFEHRARQR